MSESKQVSILNQGSYVTRVGTNKKPFTIGVALQLLQNLGVKI